MSTHTKDGKIYDFAPKNLKREKKSHCITSRCFQLRIIMDIKVNQYHKLKRVHHFIVQRLNAKQFPSIEVKNSHQKGEIQYEKKPIQWFFHILKKAFISNFWSTQWKSEIWRLKTTSLWRQSKINKCDVHRHTSIHY